MAPKRQHRFLAARSGSRALVTIAALIAIALQAFIVQTHVHAFAAPVAIAAQAGQASADHAEHASNGHAQAACVICMTLAASGRATLANAAALSAEHRASFDVATFVLPRAPPAISHAWQSRAPPIAL